VIYVDIKMIVEKLINEHGTNDPFAIADNLNIIILRPDMHNVLGFFSRYNRTKFIHLNNDIPENLKKFVCAHELAHAIMHPDANTPFLKRCTLLSTLKIERQANTFAVECLMTDSLLREYSYCGMYNLAASLGIPIELIDLKIL
jgi:Zn-dependent peptidase ImmA (M78 family)